MSRRDAPLERIDLRLSLGLVLLVAAIVLSPAAAYGDSDGYYCIGSGYVAYQFGVAAPPVRPHRLYVVNFRGATHINQPTVIELPQFQVHGITCSGRAIQLLSYNDVYTVRLNPTNAPVGYESVPLSVRGETPPTFVGAYANLASLSTSAKTLTTDRVKLASAAVGGQFVLETTAQPNGRCTLAVASSIVRVDRNAREVERVSVFRGLGVRDCGE